MTQEQLRELHRLLSLWLAKNPEPTPRRFYFFSALQLVEAEFLERFREEIGR